MVDIEIDRSTFAWYLQRDGVKVEDIHLDQPGFTGTLATFGRFLARVSQDNADGGPDLAWDLAGIARTDADGTFWFPGLVLTGDEG